VSARDTAPVLVTGGSGFIGQHLADALVARGRHVRVLDLRPPKSVRPEVQYLSGSASDPRIVDAALNGVDEVYHLAALPGMWMPNKQDFDLTNRLATEVVLTAARSRAVVRFLHCSTESILFPNATTTPPITETTTTTMAEMPGTYTRSKKADARLHCRSSQTTHSPSDPFCLSDCGDD
jgi:dihydroflavonol-4-reductase